LLALMVVISLYSDGYIDLVKRFRRRVYGVFGDSQHLRYIERNIVRDG
jgi:hypothetical protein